MPGGKGGRGAYDDDDYDDGYDDDYYDDEEYYEEEDSRHADNVPIACHLAKVVAADKAAASLPVGPAKGASSTGSYANKAAAIKSESYPVAPKISESATLPRFNFATPSPDDAVLHFRQNRGGQAPSTSASDHHTPLDGTTTAVEKLGLHDTRSLATPPVVAAHMIAAPDIKDGASGSSGESTAAAATPPPPAAPAPQRPYSSYTLEPALAKECAQAAHAEASGQGVKPKLHLVVLGHVDAGKSTLMGRLLHELGYVSSKTVHKNKKDAAAAGKASFSWAWVLDERSEERARGLTVDVAMSRFETDKLSLTLLDAPGHRDFVPNMITGAAQADAALLLVDGSPGGFEHGFEEGVGSTGGGQTREHAQLARSLGVEQLAVVISKLDTCNFDQQRFQHIKGVLGPFLKGCGFKDSAVQWLPAVGPTAENLTKPPQHPHLSSWWRGPTVVDAINKFRPPERNVQRPLRMPITDVLKRERGGVAVGGKLEGGALRCGVSVCVMPAGVVGTVKSIEVDGKACALARSGDSCDVVLNGVDPLVLVSGAVLCHPDWPVRLAHTLEARVVVLDVQIPILRGQQGVIHAHSAKQECHVSSLVSVLDPKSGNVSRQRPRCLLKGQTAVIEITVSKPLCLEQYADYRALGRIALRDAGRTLAVGIVTKIIS